LTVEPLAPQEQRTFVGGVASVSYQLPVAARVQGLLLRDGREVARTPETSQEDGQNQIAMSLTDSNGDPLPPGIYEATIEASDGIDRVRAQPVLVSAQAIPEHVFVPPPGRPDRTNARLALFVAAMLGAALVAIVAWQIRRRRLSRT